MRYLRRLSDLSSLLNGTHTTGSGESLINDKKRGGNNCTAVQYEFLFYILTALPFLCRLCYYVFFHSKSVTVHYVDNSSTMIT
jgi:hypothetical protein